MSETRSVPKPAPKEPKLRKRVKATNPKRRKSEFARTYGSKERVEWVKSQPCVITGEVPSENAHIVTGGMGRKADYTKIVPLCPVVHQQFHRLGRIVMEKWYGVDFAALAAETERKWLARNAAPHTIYFIDSMEHYTTTPK